jgi:uncharacterized OsmC-like protein
MAGQLNGVDMAPLGQFVEGVKTGAISKDIRFAARSRWQGGTKTEVTVDRFYAGGQNAAPDGRRFTLQVDEPGALGGSDMAANPMEYLAAALCGCITAGIATNAEMFGTAVEGIEVEVDLDMDVLGLFGIDRSVSSQTHGISYTVRLKGPDKEALARAKATIDGKSPVRNTLANAIPMTTRIVVD